MPFIFEKDKEFTLIKDGEYEAIIESAEIKTIPSGRDKIALTYKIREINNQAFANRKIFEDIWEDKDVKGLFNEKRLNKLMSSALPDLKDGTTFESINDVLNSLIGQKLIIVVKTEFDDYYGKDRNRIYYYKKTKAPDQKMEDIDLPFSDEELPF